ncbi:MAG: AMP-binding protein [Candidatus Binatia bacterium]
MEEHDWINIIPVLEGVCDEIRQQHMTNISTAISDLPPEQQAIRDKCFHPTGKFIEFKRDEIEQSIPDRFEQMVRKYPNRLAVKTGTHQFTYDELNKAANRVARAIVGQCGERHKQVALLFEHNAPMIGAILGALKARKMYVPLDPLYPLSRTAYILKDSQAGLIVTNTKNLSLAKRLVQGPVSLINIDRVTTSLSAKNLDLSLSSDPLAYILYTSGSTGQPKGVVQNHRNVLHEVMLYTNTLRICPDDRMTLFYSYSVNGSVRGIFGPLLNGAAVYPFDIKHEGLANLADFLIREEITFYISVPTVFRSFVAGLTGKEKFPRLRLCRFGGERVLIKDVELYKKYFSATSILYTGMGSTETGWIRQYFLDKQSQITGTVVPTGYPVQDKKILLLGESREEIGVGHAGEIAVSSDYLSPGYWQNPHLTQTRFPCDPGSEAQRIYLTGDLGRMRPDGSLEHLGRRDFQVKVRGFRIEVAEIELALLDIPGINEAIVTSREDGQGDPCLVAYLVLRNSFGPSTEELRRYLKGRLPDYMIPTAFVNLKRMPLTPNGKVDRRALPTLGRSRPNLNGTFVAPHTPVEVTVAGVWAEVLGLDQVGIYDNFFDLGGHSLNATQVISRVIKTFKVELPIKSLFESPTVAGMALIITENMAKKAGDEELARMLAELESISNEEAQKRLADESK